MPCKFKVEPQKASMIRGAIRNLFDGTSFASLKFFIDQMENEAVESDANDLDSFIANMPSGSTLLVNNESTFFSGSYDLLLLKKERSQLIGKLLNNRVGSSIKAVSSSKGETIENIISQISETEHSRDLDDSTFSVLLFNGDGNRLIPEFYETARQFDGDWVTYPTTSKQNEIKSETKREEKTMTKLTSVIDKNKAALVQAGKIEAGSIVMKRISKLVTPQLPFMVRGYADTPAGRLVMANIFNFAVTQYAGNNKNAVLLADAALQGSMVEMLQSFNFNDLIDKVIEGVDTSKLISSDNE